MSSVMSSVMSNQPYQPLEKVEPTPLAVSEVQPLEKVEPNAMRSEECSEDLAPPFSKVDSKVESNVESKDLAPPFPKVVKVVKVVKEAVEKLSKKYNFEVEEALLYLSQPLKKVEPKVKSESLKNQPLKKVEPKVKSESLKKVEPKIEKLKAKYPMPFDGVKREECCNGLVKNHGLYTQCSKKVKGVEGVSSFGSTFSKGGLCKGCEKQPYGNIEDRVKVGLYEYKDPKGKSPKRYTEVLKTLKLSKEEVEEEAKRLNIVIAAEHLEELVVENVKRGRPKTEKKVKEATGKKGRPKKENKKVEVNDDEEEDLFATLIANAQPSPPLEKVEPNPMPLEGSSDVIVEEAKDLAPPLAKVEKVEKKSKKVDPVKEGEKQKKAEEKAAKDAAKEVEKQKKAEEKAAKEVEKQKKAEEKAAKEALKESKKKSKDLAPPFPKVDKKSKDLAPPFSKVEKVDKEEEADVVKKFEFEGNSYYKSKKSGVIYNMEQEVVGKWNEERKGIDFEEEEEEEEEYDD